MSPRHKSNKPSVQRPPPAKPAEAPAARAPEPAASQTGDEAAQLPAANPVIAGAPHSPESAQEPDDALAFVAQDSDVAQAIRSGSPAWIMLQGGVLVIANTEIIESEPPVAAAKPTAPLDALKLVVAEELKIEPDQILSVKDYADRRVVVVHHETTVRKHVIHGAPHEA